MLTEPVACRRVRLAEQQARLRDPCPRLPSAGITRYAANGFDVDAGITRYAADGLDVDAGIRTRVLLFSQQAFHPLSHLLNPAYDF